MINLGGRDNLLQVIITTSYTSTHIRRIFECLRLPAPPVRTDPKLSVRGLARLIEQVGKAAYNLGYTPGLNPAQWAAMRYFDEATHERQTVTGFAQFQGTTKGT